MIRSIKHRLNVWKEEPINLKIVIMKKVAFGILVLSTVFAVNAQAQHSSHDEASKHRPTVIFQREITSLPDVKGQEAR